MVDGAFSDVHSCYIAMTCRALDGGAKVRGMVESHMRFIIPPVDSLPRDVFAAIMVREDFLDLRTVRKGVHVAVPAGSYIRNTGLRPSRCGNMTIGALQLHRFNVGFVGERYGL